MGFPLSPYHLGKARGVYNVFNIFNSLSWNLLVGSIITLFALRLGASATYIGLINAMVYISYFFLPLGKIFARRFSIIGIYSFAWIWRALCMIPVMAAPFVEYLGQRNLAFLLVITGVFFFHFFRGVGMIGNNPVLSELAAGPDRGSYLTQLQIVNSVVTMLGSLLVAIALGGAAPVWLYSVIFGIGIICGIASGSLIKKVPEPAGEGENNIRLAALFKEAFSQSALRLFVLIFFLVAMVSSVSRAFVVVYAREVFGHDDGMVSLYTVFGALGYLAIGLFIKFLIDRIGAKPIYIICVIIGSASMFPIVFFPAAALSNMAAAIIFLSFLFFMLNFGFLGSEGIAQTYFMGFVPEKKMLDMGILFFFIFGLAGAGGSFLAGLFLDLLAGFGFSAFISFKLLFAIAIVFSLGAVFLQKKLIPLGSLSFTDALKVIFSFRDLQAITILDRLNKTLDSHEEEALLTALHNNPSRLSIKKLLERARSPRLVTRLEAIRAMETLDTLDEDTENALISDIVNNPFTTAYISGRILGKQNCFSAIPLLRELVSSTDYMLAGEAMIALANLKDNTFRPQIEQIILGTENPRLKIMGVEALGMYGSPDSLSVLLGVLRVADPPPYLRDEVVLAMSAILDTQNEFYPILVNYLADPSLAATLAMDEAEAAFEYYRTNLGGKKGRNEGERALIGRLAAGIQEAVAAVFHDNNGVPLSRWIMDLPGGTDIPIVQPEFSEALLDDELSLHNRLRLLIVHWAGGKLKAWTKRLK